MRARRIEPDEYPQAHDALVRLSSTVGVETPDLAVARTDVPNAFAVGRRPAHATVVVTTGLLDLLDPEKLDAVLAHELAHVGNRDVGVMTLAYFLPSFAYLVAIGAYLVLVASSARWRASGTSTTWVPAMPVGPWLVRSVPEYCSATSPSESVSSW